MTSILMGNRRASTASANPPQKKRGVRRDIQGLRAIAVLAVIADHLFHWPTGGFVGVDVFFVISGFIITGVLLREHDRTGRISFPDFYRRRARRILPLAVLVLLATVVASYLLFNIGRTKIIADDALWSLLFGANWHFAAIGTDYMNAGAALSPVQHFWSLAVEEQFYFVWPWLIVLVLGIVASRAAWSRMTAMRILGFALLVVTALSFVFAIWETNTSPTVAYFSTFSRAWELGVGALIALTASTLGKIPAFVRPILAYIGLAGIVYSLFWINPSTPFPGPWAFLPVVSSGLVIAAGCGGGQRFLTPITNRVSNYVGDISYSLYMWHFPLIVIGSALVPAGLWFDLAALVAVLTISSVSYHLLEDPIRRSSWLEPKSVRKQLEPLKLSALPYLCVLMVITLAVVGGALWNDHARSQPLPAAARVPVAPPALTNGVPSAVAAHAAKVLAAATAADWPDLKPKIEELGPAAKAPEWVDDGCLGLQGKSISNPIANAQRCVYGPADAAKTAVVVGDSMAISYVPGIREALEPRGYKVLVYTVQQCPAVTVTMLNDDRSPHPECDPFREWALGEVKKLQPDLVIMTSSAGASGTLASGAKGRAAIDEWKDGALRTFTELSDAAKRVVVLDPPPGGKNLQECRTLVSKPADCATVADERYNDIAKATSEAALASPAKPAVEIVNTKSWFCSPENVCPSFIGTVPVYADTGHLTATMSKTLSPVFVEALQLEPAS
ncbi:acyltransferase [Arthrobacter sp. 24S4-2]|uniref:acyltransferase family protein n=1 Tax=Arthrobacter sp. 24S4-2 TaxID=2575374 RepID=UPI0010C7AF0E|nr:acyltransferase family protein [Arthrobacter sp. 24S4-2]QCO99582.1 acyltransferase [Arthrobacter sp. 24S4-2]